MKPALVILAAGASERLGTCKALVELGRDARGLPLTPLSLLLAAGADLDDLPPLVIGGRHAAEIAAAVPHGPGRVECAVNPVWEQGRTGGIALAAKLRPGRDLCLAPVDVPLVSRAVFAALARAWEVRGAPSRGWLAPACVDGASDQRYGHPVIVGRELLGVLAGWAPDRPLRDLRAQAFPLDALAVKDFSVLDDLDTPLDLQRMRAKFAL